MEPTTQQKQQFSSLMTRIVSECMPTELSVFELKRDRLMSDPHARNSSKPTDAGFEIGQTTKAVIESVPLLLGSLKALLEIVKAARDMRSSGRKATEFAADHQQQWSRELQNAGLSPERADEISQRFRDEFAEVVKS